EIGVGCIQVAPIGWREVIFRPAGEGQVEPEVDHRLAVTPGTRADSVAGCHVDALAIRADAPGRPGAAAAGAGGPVAQRVGRPQRNSDNPAPVVSAIAVV